VTIQMNLRVETPDLIRSCPIWNAGYLRAEDDPAPLYRRIFGLRERWSREVVTVSTPFDINGILSRDLHTSLQCLSYWRCQSKAFWKVVGPPELLNDLRGTNRGKVLQWSHGLSVEEVVASAPLQFYLCQHEITGH
jgi:hypothetical protein